MADKPVFTLQQVIDQLTRSNQEWSPGQTINFTFFNAVPAEGVNDPQLAGFRPFSTEQRQAVREVFQMISELVRLDFKEVPDNGRDHTQRASLITFGNTNFVLSGSAVGIPFADAPGPDGIARIYGAESWFNNPSVREGLGTKYPGGAEYSVYIHEIGHTLGLAHPGSYNANDGTPLTYDSNAEYAQDTWQYTQMSYWPSTGNGSEWISEGVYYHSTTFRLHDIAALQALYGADTTTRTGDTVYGFNSTADRPWFSLSTEARTPRVFTIWDAGGVDTLDVSGYASNSIVDIAQGGFTSTGGLRNNIAIAFGATVENAVGGAGDDQISGNSAANLLKGGAGQDTLQGGLGVDTLEGGLGVDWFTGGVDSDTYVIRDGDNALSAPDVIWDFEEGTDKLDLSGHGAAARVSITYLGGSSFVYVDGNGDGAQDGLTVASARLVRFGGDVALPGSSGITFFGSAGNSEVVGSGRGDVYIGGAGDDRMRGAGGSDAYYGGAGRDTVFLRQGDSTLSAPDVAYDHAFGVDKVDVVSLGFTGARFTVATDGSSSYLYIDENADGVSDGLFITYLGRLDGSDIIGGVGNPRLTVFGSVSGDTLRGGGDADVIAAYGGEDLIVGGGGADQLYGGIGGDTFRYEALSDSLLSAFDYVHDFTSGADKLDLRALNTSAASTMLASTFAGSTFVYVDQNGDGAQDFLVVLTGVTSTAGGDILF